MRRLPTHFRWIALLPLAMWAFALRAQSPAELLRKWEENFYGKSAEMEIRMTIKRPEWTRTALVKFWTLGQDYALLLVKEPKKDAGTVYLKRNDEVWSYVPSIDRVMKMAPGMMSQSWLGSDFTHEDIVRKTSITDDYTHRIVGSESLDGVACHVIELIPREDAPVVWGKLKVWLSKEGNQQHKVEYFDEDGVLVNSLRFGDIRPMGGRTIPTRLVMTPAARKGYSTTLEYVSVNYAKALSVDFFTQQNMTRVQ
jgi:outer membrane lipoprotein-sorting protein